MTGRKNYFLNRSMFHPALEQPENNQSNNVTQNFNTVNQDIKRINIVKNTIVNHIKKSHLTTAKHFRRQFFTKSTELFKNYRFSQNKNLNFSTHLVQKNHIANFNRNSLLNVESSKIVNNEKMILSENRINNKFHTTKNMNLQLVGNAGAVNQNVQFAQKPKSQASLRSLTQLNKNITRVENNLSSLTHKSEFNTQNLQNELVKKFETRVAQAVNNLKSEVTVINEHNINQKIEQNISIASALIEKKVIRTIERDNRISLSRKGNL